MGKTRKKYSKNNKGGNVLASGGYGCVFKPALKCENTNKREKNKISKIMTERHAIEEYGKITSIKEKLDLIPNYEDYFLLYDTTLCRPAKLTAKDLTFFKSKCTALPKDNITKSNINTKLNDIMIINMPNGGLPVDDYIYTNGSFQQIYNVHNNLVKLLKHGIIPMNERNIYHSDIKDSNILVDYKNNEFKTRLIDWGLGVEYEPNHLKFPKNWRNRPLQFNVPFSVVIFSDSFYEKYSEYLNSGGEVNKISLKPFVINYLNSWMRDRGPGHYKFINEIMYKLYSKEISNVSEKNKPVYVETQITMPIIVDYIVNVLDNYTKFRENGELNLREYLNKVFIKIIDIYGFINSYYPLLELLYNNYSILNANEIKLYNKVCSLFKEYLYTPQTTPYNMNDLLTNLNNIGKLLQILARESENQITTSSPLASGIKTKKRKIKSKSTLFKRKPFVKKFKKPLFLSIK